MRPAHAAMDRIDQDDVMIALPKFDRGGNSINPSANNNDFRHLGHRTL